ncbi:MAG: hypothetical protein II685_05480 [Clostridia bacterium]|nr:hypothetical protein [Clostridia bacterium]
MKKTIAAAACLMAIAATFTACNTEDGRVDDNSTTSVTSRVNEINRNNAESRIVSDRNNGIVNSRDESAVNSERRAERDNINDDVYDNNDNEGVIHDIGSMVGAGVEDVADGIDNIGSSVASNVNDAVDNDPYDYNYESDNM